MAKKNKARQENISEATAAAAPVPAPVEEAIEFDSWYSLRAPKIPKHHRKEILMADFGGRGLSMCEPASVFDAALKKYGVSLN